MSYARVGQPPSWLDAATLRLMETERNKAFVWGRDALAAAEMVRELLLARRPALPMTMIDEAVAAVVPDPAGASFVAPVVPEGERQATRQEIVETLSYGLRFNLEGKPRRTGHEHLAPLAAAHLAEHLMRSGFSILRRVPQAGCTGRVGDGAPDAG